MKLVLGGYAQGKLHYVLQRNPEKNYRIWDGRLPTEEELQQVAVGQQEIVINHFHNWAKEQIRQKCMPEKELEAFLKRESKCIIISDEIGNGIVPMDAFEREYRERTGRMLIQIASRADEVVRVLCGIGQKIK